MQDRPDKATLLDALVQFLMAEVHPHVTDKTLAFRVLIAANLANIVASEIRTEDDHYDAEVARLRAILPDVVPDDAARIPRGDARRAALAGYNRELAARIRGGRFDDASLGAVWAHVRATLRETLAVANPRFDTSDEIE